MRKRIEILLAAALMTGCGTDGEQPEVDARSCTEWTSTYIDGVEPNYVIVEPPSLCVFDIAGIDVAGLPDENGMNPDPANGIAIFSPSCGDPQDPTCVTGHTELISGTRYSHRTATWTEDPEPGVQALLRRESPDGNGVCAWVRCAEVQ